MNDTKSIAGPGPNRVGIHLTVEVPEVEIRPLVTAVVCGKTTVEVKEHGHHGGGDGGAWWGHSCAVGGTIGFPYDDALAAAKQMAHDTERNRLLQVALRDQLDKDGSR